MPKVQYQAWLNYVQEVEIELFGFESLENAMLLRELEDFSLSNESEYEDKGYYRRLNEGLGEIRLISLNPGFVDDPVSCSFAYTSQFDISHPCYEGLSYCWEDQSDRRDIKLLSHNAKQSFSHHLSITSSLYAAMKNLKRDDGQVRVLWIDAICINQKGLHERSQHVAMVREVYSRADNVVVWLGNGDEKTR